MPGSHVHIGKKTVSSDVSGNYLIKRLPSGNAKIFPVLVFNLLML
jgi:iron complex outermembrane receptor protein